MKTKILFAIFAHPDDESFGPSGYIRKQVEEGLNVHVICVTDGGATNNKVETRQLEFQQACIVLGVEGHQLNFADGSLSNNNYHSVIARIRDKILQILEAYTDGEVAFLTFEKCGLTGHIDHIAVSFATTYLYTHADSWLTSNFELGHLRYFCLCDAQKNEDLDYFVYSPKGYPEEEVDETVDVTDVLKTKIKAIQMHVSQKDAIKALARGKHLLSQEHFLVYKKDSHHIF